MNDIKDFVSNVILGNNVEAKENFNDLVSARAMDALAERKQQIAQSLFQTEQSIEEEAEPIEEISKSTLGSYIKKASHDVAAKGATTRKFAMDSEKQRKDQDYVGARKSMERADKSFAKSWKRREGMAKAVDRLTKEDVESIEEKAVSQQQQKFMGMVYAAKKGMTPASPEVAKAAASMTKKQAKDYAATSHEGLPKKVNQEGVAGAIAGGVLGGLTGGPAGAIAGGYLGHKTQQAANNTSPSKKM